MANIGNQLTSSVFVCDTFSGTGSQTVFTGLTFAPAATAAIAVFVGGSYTSPTLYSVAGTTLTFTSAPTAGTNNIKVLHLGVGQTAVVPADGSVSNVKIQATGTANSTTYLRGDQTWAPLSNTAISGYITASQLETSLNLQSKTITLPANTGFDYASSSDPAYNTNPSKGVGSAWKNTTSGEIFICTDATSNVNIWKGTNGNTIAAEFVLYNKLSGANIDQTSWNWTYSQAVSTHNFSNDSNGLYIYDVGTGSTYAGVYTYAYTTATIAIPSYAANCEITMYVQVKDSNQQDTGGSIIVSFGSTQNSGDFIEYDVGGNHLGTQDDVTITFNVPVSSIAGTNKYFRTYGAGGQYCNVIYYIKKIRFIV
jgi:hypothetical protein